MRIGSAQQAGQPLERDRRRAVERQALRRQPSRKIVGPATGRTQPQSHAAAALTMMAGIAFDDRIDLVRHAVVAGVEQHAGPRQCRRQRLDGFAAGERDRRAVAHQGDPFRRHAGRAAGDASGRSPSTSKPSIRRRQKLVSASSRASARDGRGLRRDQAFGMKVGDAVDQAAAPQELQRRQQMDHERRRAGEQHAVGGAQRRESPP